MSKMTKLDAIFFCILTQNQITAKRMRPRGIFEAQQVEEEDLGLTWQEVKDLEEYDGSSWVFWSRD